MSMFKRILELFFGKPAEPTVAPYKVEPPVENVVVVDRGNVVSMPVPKAVVVDASLDIKPVVAETPAKKPRKPRANVAAKKIAAAKKPAAKKPTPTPN